MPTPSLGNAGAGSWSVGVQGGDPATLDTRPEVIGDEEAGHARDTGVGWTG